VAIKLQFDTIIVPRAHFTRCRDLPEFLGRLRSDGGFVFDINWYDAHLWCETAMSDADEIVAEWEARGLLSGAPLRAERGKPWKWLDLCVAASGRGVFGTCDWLEYDAADNCVWLKGTEKGPVVGGRDQHREETAKLDELREKAERHYTAMYDASHPKDNYEDACAALAKAVRLASFLWRPDLEAEIRQRAEHIAAVYNTQFRLGGPL